jgi:hypothetical protein
VTGHDARLQILATREQLQALGVAVASYVLPPYPRVAGNWWNLRYWLHGRLRNEQAFQELQRTRAIEIRSIMKFLASKNWCAAAVEQETQYILARAAQPLPYPAGPDLCGCTVRALCDDCRPVPA